jgi:hypothetical protein
MEVEVDDEAEVEAKVELETHKPRSSVACSLLMESRKAARSRDLKHNLQTCRKRLAVSAQASPPSSLSRTLNATERLDSASNMKSSKQHEVKQAT